MVSAWDIAKSPDMLNYVAKNLGDPWIGTPFQGYRMMGNKQKGEYGERLVKEYFTKLGRKVEKPDTSTAGHDLKVDDILIEIKFSLSHTDTKKNTIKYDCFTMNHVAIGKDWQRLVFVGINKDEKDVRIKFITKEDFIRLRNTDDFWTYFSCQQGGKHGNNDDYISADKKLLRFINSKWVYDISDWEKV